MRSTSQSANALYLFFTWYSIDRMILLFSQRGGIHENILQERWLATTYRAGGSEYTRDVDVQ